MFQTPCLVSYTRQGDLGVCHDPSEWLEGDYGGFQWNEYRHDDVPEGWIQGGNGG